MTRVLTAISALLAGPLMAGAALASEDVAIRFETAACVTPHVTLETAALSEAGAVRARVTNRADIALSGALFIYEIATPGRAVPWAEGVERVHIPGGVEPGETRDGIAFLPLPPLDESWFRPLEMTITVTELVGARGRDLIGSAYLACPDNLRLDPAVLEEVAISIQRCWLPPNTQEGTPIDVTLRADFLNGIPEASSVELLETTAEAPDDREIGYRHARRALMKCFPEDYLSLHGTVRLDFSSSSTPPKITITEP